MKHENGTIADDVGIGIAGVGGRMGRMLVQAVEKRAGTSLVAACEHSGSETIGVDVGELAGIAPLGIPVVNDAKMLFERSDVVIDFTRVEAMLPHLMLAMENKTPLVIGTTGFNPVARARIEQTTQRIPIVMAPNFSVGVNLMFKITAEVARVLGEEFDVEIIEAHHRHKRDAPSGTAIRLGESVAEVLGRDLKNVAIYGREGITGERDQRTIGFSTVRGGDIVGEHTVLFAGEGERFEVTHRASSRMTFAQGAVRAALWLHGRAPGFYDMHDILGLHQKRSDQDQGM